MGRITLLSNIDPCVTVISNTFLDKYMIKANGEFLKVYLYLVRWAGIPEKCMSVDSIADTFSITERDVKRVLKYWAEEGLLRIIGSVEKDNFGITLNPMPCDVVYHMGKFDPDQAPELKEIPDYSEEDIKDFKDDFDGEELFMVLEQYTGKPLSATDVNKILFFHEELGFSVDLIEYLFEYCISNNHKSMNYIEKVAINWADNNIDTVAKAKAACKRFCKTYFEVLKAMGVSDRNPVDSEIKYIDKWQKTWSFSMDMILEACKRTVLGTGKCNFKYCDGILKGWKEKSFVTLQDVEAGDAEFAKAREEAGAVKSKKNNKFNNIGKRTFDFDDLQKQLMNKNMHNK